MSSRLLAVFIVAFCVNPVHAKLEIKKFQASYGPFGKSREKAKEFTVVPGEELTLRVHATGVTVGTEGAADTAVTVTLTDKDGKTLLTETTPNKARLSLGGGETVAFARLAVNAAAVAGDYTLKVKFEDKASGESAEVERAVTVLPTQFALVNPRFFADAAGLIPSSPGGIAGQTIHFRCQSVGLSAAERLALTLKLRVVDLNQKDMLDPPIVVRIEEADVNRLKKLSAVAFDRSVVLNRPGEFILIVQVTDEVANKSLEFSSPLTVSPP